MDDDGMRPPRYQVLDEPQKVWVTTRLLLPEDGYWRRPYAKECLQVGKPMPGFLYGWMPTSTGGMVGLVKYQLGTEDKQWWIEFTHFVSSKHLRKRSTQRGERRYD